jgi:hypothetical protein
MFMFPGRVYALNPIDALDRIHEMIDRRGLKYIGPVSLSKCVAQTSETVIWYEFYCKVAEIA